MRKAFAILVLVVLQAGCMPWNPYVRVKDRILEDGNGTVNCWMRVTDDCTIGCENERAKPALDACIETLRPHVGIFTGELRAKWDILDCMQSKGWDRPWISGTMRVE